MTGLLVELPAGYPPDYVMARVRGRSRTQLKTLAAAEPDSGWKLLRGEYRWCYRQLDRPTRVALAPFFFFQEIPAMMTAARFAMNGEEIQARESLTDSLLAAPLVGVLCRQEHLGEKASRLSRQLSELCPLFPPLGEIPEHASPLLFERKLRAASHGAILRQRLHPAVRGHLDGRFQRLFLLARLKVRRWAQQEKERMDDMDGSPDSPPLFRRSPDSLLRKLAGADIPPVTDGLSASLMNRIEEGLHATQSEELAREAFQEQGLTVILQYLQRLTMTAMGMVGGSASRLAEMEQDGKG